MQGYTFMVCDAETSSNLSDIWCSWFFVLIHVGVECKTSLQRDQRLIESRHPCQRTHFTFAQPAVSCFIFVSCAARVAQDVTIQRHISGCADVKWVWPPEVMATSCRQFPVWNTTPETLDCSSWSGYWWHGTWWRPASGQQIHLVLEDDVGPSDCKRLRSCII